MVKQSGSSGRENEILSIPGKTALLSYFEFRSIPGIKRGPRKQN